MFDKVFFESRVICEIITKNMVETKATNDVTIWRIPGACWISKATCTQAYVYAHKPRHTNARTHKYTIFIAFPRQQ